MIELLYTAKNAGWKFINSKKYRKAVIRNKTSATHYSDSIHVMYCNSAVAIQYNVTQTYSRNIIMDTTNNQQLTQSLSGSSSLCVKVISNTKKTSGGYVKHNNLLWCRVSKGDYMFRPFSIRPSSSLTWWKP